MKIAQLVSNFYATSPTAYHAIYSHAAWLSNGLKKLNNDVTLYASGDSKVTCDVKSVLPKAIDSLGFSENIKKYYLHLLISKCYGDAEKYDIIHSHFNLLSSFYSRLVKTPTVNSIHSPIDEDAKPLLLQFKNAHYISFSQAQRKIIPELNWVGNIYHGVNMDIFSFNPKPQDYFFYLGRLTEKKGIHLAIETARAAKVPLLIAGRSYPQESYWHDKIEKYIDGKNIRYVGEANFMQKIEYLQNAKALLFPTQYDEVFGYVMIEAMACGTPVIGWRSGAVPEVIQDGQTGYVVQTVNEMVKAIKSVDKISREETRKRAERYFSVNKMVAGYQKIYERVISETAFKKAKKEKTVS
ncbi:MAG: glycosyltransferase family 4 protein [Candidatus Colwellbacteria bacterium]|jgi:glycosyltransferase involved in cell wall biosynthesis|nr:glycosyltransferase family 4 protein [Candidatus Colwellbacteria bacterium]MCK9497421.1 glycosyltransferase family 4 protein [Candidatus Colwellbacteria bacterium]MDD3752586.1 glycosyltransferase family 4 protein [Candidatus Colwellbacteria bacterium]MDD4818614.1 glycosyltransferase family 4 protein [Candidatus Colwellbacteria bacterium]